MLGALGLVAECNQREREGEEPEELIERRMLTLSHTQALRTVLQARPNAL